MCEAHAQDILYGTTDTYDIQNSLKRAACTSFCNEYPSNSLEYYKQYSLYFLHHIFLVFM